MKNDSRGHADDAVLLNALSGRVIGKVTGLRLCLLLNFGNPRLEIKRVANGL